MGIVDTGFAVGSGAAGLKIALPARAASATPASPRTT
jgi:hypothetical protein